ncbi:piggyBac transposable element-derived protein 4-like [Euwallacea fornicatus]|uniref:piggyBac transposable element-derived protein 4-like n=1 Tax=Euwallacea fornicatus TaxID=995702 RepID=UPI0033906C68
MDELDEDDIPLSQLRTRSKHIASFENMNLKGKNGHKWSTQIPKKSKRTAARNIVHFISDPKGAARDCSTLDEYFLHFCSDKILNIILEHTNAQIAIQSEKFSGHQNVSQTTKDELKAMFGILVLSAAKKDNHLSVKHMFDITISGTFYRACMSYDRFYFLLNCLRFDAKETRQERKLNDPFAHIREIWDILIETCKTSYTPSSYLTIDEQLLAFRGRCPFRMYIPNKPAKYGVKIVMVCDSSTKYMLDASPYLGKKTPTNGLPLSEFYIKELTKSVHGTNRNITMDNWFTSVSLADQLLQDPYKLTMIGTIRKNKREIPNELLNVKSRIPNTSMFCFDKKKTLLSYMPRKNKIVLLLSTMHEGAEVMEPTGRPAIIHNYNQTKGSVDTFDQMCSNMNSSRKTRRWPLCVFYGMINMSSINSYVIYTFNILKTGKKPLSRYQYMINLSQCLAKSWMLQRYNSSTLRRNLRQDIASILDLGPEEDANNPQEKKRKTCFYCPSQKRRMTTNFCKDCKQPICGEHRGNICKKCTES